LDAKDTLDLNLAAMEERAHLAEDTARHVEQTTAVAKQAERAAADARTTAAENAKSATRLGSRATSVVGTVDRAFVEATQQAADRAVAAKLRAIGDARALSQELQGALEWLRGPWVEAASTPRGIDGMNPTAYLSETVARLGRGLDRLHQALGSPVAQSTPWETRLPRPPSPPPAAGGGGGRTSSITNSFTEEAVDALEFARNNKMLVFFGALTAIDMANSKSVSEVVDKGSRAAMAYMGASIGTGVCGGPVNPFSPLCGLAGGFVGAYAPEIKDAAVTGAKFVGRAAVGVGKAIWGRIDLNALQAQMRTP
jgi:hypothetical protein